MLPVMAMQADFDTWLSERDARGKTVLRGNGTERSPLPRRAPGRLLHVQLHRLALRQRPVEPGHEVGERELHHGHGEVHPRAHPAPRAERDQLEVPAPEVHGAAGEPIRAELLRRLPGRRVPADRPRVHDHGGAAGDIVPAAADLGGLHGLVREQQGPRRVQPHRLLDHGSQVLHSQQIVLADHVAVAAATAAGAPSMSSHLALQLLHDPLVAEQLRHGPFEDDDRRLCPGAEQVLHLFKGS
jgi:hypothetical protein